MRHLRTPIDGRCEVSTRCEVGAGRGGRSGRGWRDGVPGPGLGWRRAHRPPGRRHRPRRTRPPRSAIRATGAGCWCSGCSRRWPRSRSPSPRSQQPQVRYALDRRRRRRRDPAHALPAGRAQRHVDCAAVRATARLLLSTVPLRPDPAADPLAGLRLTGGRPERVDRRGVTSARRRARRGSRCPGPVHGHRHLRPAATTVSVDDRVRRDQRRRRPPGRRRRVLRRRPGVTLRSPPTPGSRPPSPRSRPRSPPSGCSPCSGLLVALARADRAATARAAAPAPLVAAPAESTWPSPRCSASGG